MANETDANETLPVATRFRWGIAGLVGLVLLAGGGAMFLASGDDPEVALITDVRITQRTNLANPSGAADDVLDKLKRLGTKPSYYLELQTPDGAQQTDVKENTPIGNGLTFGLKEPIPLASIREIQVRHDGWFTEPIVDRVEVTGPAHEGQIFHFDLLGTAVDEPTSRLRLAAWITMGLGALGVIVTVVRFVYQQAI